MVGIGNIETIIGMITTRLRLSRMKKPTHHLQKMGPKASASFVRRLWLMIGRNHGDSSCVADLCFRSELL